MRGKREAHFGLSKSYSLKEGTKAGKGRKQGGQGRNKWKKRGKRG